MQSLEGYRLLDFGTAQAGPQVAQLLADMGMEVINHRQIKAMEFFVELDHKKAGKLKYTKGPCTFEKTDWEWQTAAPQLGQDNGQVYCDRLGYSQKELAGMKKSGVI